MAEEKSPETKAPEPPKPPLSPDGRPATQKVERALPPGAREALGGEPFPAPGNPAAAAARQLRAEADPAPRIGNPSFDPPAPGVIERRESIAAIKAGVLGLIGEIERTDSRVQPRLEPLIANAKEVKAKEDFDPKEVAAFLEELKGAIAKLKKA